MLHAQQVEANPLESSPLVDPLWLKANWSRLVPPLNDNRSAAPTQVACAYDANNLYVAFVCASNEMYAGVARGKPWENDSVEVWLDTASTPMMDEQGQPMPAHAAGCEVFRIVATPAGGAYTYWYRSATPPQPQEDGTPNFAHPITMNPVALNKVPGLKVKFGNGTLDGQAAWTAVVALPLASLPKPLSTKPQPGAHWHANLIRNDWIKTPEGNRDLVQSNFAPIYQSAQAVSPYRMADLVLDSNLKPVLTLNSGN